ncbi:MAG: PilZ domain-containing protein [Devosia sp.]
MNTDHEKRRDNRRKVLKGAFISFNAGRSTLNCVVRNVSDSGALLTMANSIGVPDQFDLLFGDEKRHCVVVRRSLQSLAVSFAD